MDSVPSETWGEIAVHVALDIDKYCWRLVCRTFAACLPRPRNDYFAERRFGKDRAADAALEYGSMAQIMLFTHHASKEPFKILCTRGDAGLFRNYYDEHPNVGCEIADSAIITLYPTTIPMAKLLVELYGRLPDHQIQVARADFELWALLHPLAGPLDYAREFDSVVSVLPRRVRDLDKKIDILLPLVPARHVPIWLHSAHAPHVFERLMPLYRERIASLTVPACSWWTNLVAVRWLRSIVDDDGRLRAAVSEVHQTPPDVLQYLLVEGLVDASAIDWYMHMWNHIGAPLAFLRQWVPANTLPDFSLQLLFLGDKEGRLWKHYTGILDEARKVAVFPPLYWREYPDIYKCPWLVDVVRIYLSLGYPLPTGCYVRVQGTVSPDEERFYQFATNCCVSLAQYLQLRLAGVHLPPICLPLCDKPMKIQYHENGEAGEQVLVSC